MRKPPCPPAEGDCGGGHRGFMKAEEKTESAGPPRVASGDGKEFSVEAASQEEREAGEVD